MLVAALALLAAPPTPPPSAPARPPTDVAAVTIYPATPPPKVVSSYPAEGAAVRSGVLILKVTFDQRMVYTGFDIGPVAGAEMPACVKTPRLLDDGRTFLLLCTVRGGRAYSVALNSAGPTDAPNNGFSNVAERRALPVTLSFTTLTGSPVWNLDEAMKVQGLSHLEVPIQEGPAP